jgi:hypothetical protein
MIRKLPFLRKERKTTRNYGIINNSLRVEAGIQNLKPE